MTPETHRLALTLDPATKEQLDAAERLCVELKAARDALDRAIELVPVVVRTSPASEKRAAPAPGTRR